MAIPRFKVPITMGATGLETVEQDSADDVAQCVYVVLATPVESRLEQPDFGIEDPTFEQVPVNTDAWLEAVGEWEPRASTVLEEDLVDGVVRVQAEVGVAA